LDQVHHRLAVEVDLDGGSLRDSDHSKGQEGWVASRTSALGSNCWSWSIRSLTVNVIGCDMGAPCRRASMRMGCRVAPVVAAGALLVGGLRGGVMVRRWRAANPATWAAAEDAHGRTLDGSGGLGVRDGGVLWR
jgi:hypothetical protein